MISSMIIVFMRCWGGGVQLSCKFIARLLNNAEKLLRERDDDDVTDGRIALSNFPL